ncbi:DNA gyrase subunit A [Thermoplasmatales archaeon BRNA1]|nr:DNA gyrase subunit A [Thermoplasmatales archaeon BRNA1]
MCDIMEGEERILKQTVEKEMKRSYIDYSMSVIVSRALPDVRDGLKPVHRKILYAMHELGLSYNRPHKKSATVVGEVLGKYHPHGDSAAYGAMVRLGQDFAMRYPLIDGQGNFGSVDGDPPAAMRYTEARLSKMASDLLLDLDKGTVDFIDNFDGSLKEPSILPSKFPNLLVNGSDGIAVGMATKMPPHNLREVCDAIIYTIDTPDADVPALMQFVKGPDFPTGGIINGIAGIIDAYTTGRGRIKVRAKTHFEEIRGGKTAIIVDEIPYQVNKAELVKSIADLVKNKAIVGITDLRDESDRKGMRVVIELHKDAIDEVVLQNLFSKTQMEITYGIINLALVNNKPTTLGLKELIMQYIAHRRTVVTRRTQFELDECAKRFHILEGLMAALNMLDETIKLIRASKDGAEANAGLQNLLHIDQIQAQAILDMRLQKLTGLELDSVREEYEQLKARMEDLRDILAKPARVDAIIKDELTAMKDAYGDDRRTEVNEAAVDVDAEDLIPKEETVYTISEDNYVKRLPLRTYKQQNRGGTGMTGLQTKEGDTVRSMFVASSHDYLMFVTNTGRILWLKGYNIPEGSRQAKGKPVVNLLPDLQEGEIVTNVIPTADFPEDKCLVFCTRNGLIKKTQLSAYGNVRNKGIKAIRLDDDDELVEVWMSKEGDEIVLASTDGQAIRFPEFEVSATGRDTRGVRGMTVGRKESVISMTVVKPEDMLLTVTENGFGKISIVSDYRLTHRGGKGVITIKCTKRNGGVMSVRKVGPEDELMAISSSGKVIRMRVSDIRQTGRNAAGVKIMDLKDGETIVSVNPVVSESDAEPPASE